MPLQQHSAISSQVILAVLSGAVLLLYMLLLNAAPLFADTLLLKAADSEGSSNVDEEIPAHVELLLEETLASLERVFGLSPKTVTRPRLARLTKTSVAALPLRALYHENTIYLAPALFRSDHLTSTLRHELVHVIVSQLSKQRAPAWIDEGLAQVLSGPASHELQFTSQYRRAALGRIPLSVLSDNLLSQGHEDSVLLGYTLARRAVQSMVFRWKLPSIRLYLERLGAGEGHSAAFAEVFGLSPEDFEEDLQRQLAIGSGSVYGTRNLSAIGIEYKTGLDKR